MAYQIKKDPISKIPKVQLPFGCWCAWLCSSAPDIPLSTAIR